MKHVAVVLSNPRAPAVDDALLRDVARELPEAQAPRWLSPGVAAEIAFEAGLDKPARKALAAELRAGLGGQPVDVAVLPAHRRRKRLLVADMDSTMIEQECIDELAAELELKDKIAAITARAMRGEIAFEPALRERVALLAGLDAAVIERLLATRITSMPGGRTLVATMRANGAHCALVSGGFTAFTGPVAARLGFDEHRSNTLVVEGGRLAGRVAEPILGAAAKLEALRELAAPRGGPEMALAVGDGANDLPMIEAAGLGVALHAKPAVAEAVEVRIDHGDLTALLYLQGHRQEEFVEGRN
jgi:phosphoserine phosphatase